MVRRLVSRQTDVYGASRVLVWIVPGIGETISGIIYSSPVIVKTFTGIIFSVPIPVTFAIGRRKRKYACGISRWEVLIALCGLAYAVGVQPFCR